MLLAGVGQRASRAYLPWATLSGWTVRMALPVTSSDQRFLSMAPDSKFSEKSGLGCAGRCALEWMAGAETSASRMAGTRRDCVMGKRIRPEGVSRLDSHSTMQAIPWAPRGYQITLTG